MQRPRVIYSVDIGDVYTGAGFHADGVTTYVDRVPTPRTLRNPQLAEQMLWKEFRALLERVAQQAPPMDGLSVSARGIMTLQKSEGSGHFGPFADVELYVLAPNVDGLKYVPILSRIEALGYDVPVYVENNVNAAMVSIAERDAICISLSGGLAASCKRGGVVQHVKGTWSCYEIGHGMRWDLPPHLTRLCHCGNNGCLEAAIGGWAMTERYGVLPEEAPEDIYAQMREDVLELLPHAIASVVRQTRVNRVLLVGKGPMGYSESDPDFVSRLKKAVDGLDSTFSPVELEVVSLREHAELHGSVLAFLSYCDD